MSALPNSPPLMSVIPVTPNHEWRNDGKGFKPFVIQGGNAFRLASSPLPGSQTAFINCPLKEALYSGNRGCGKTETLLMDFMKELDKGYGEHWRGIVFRREYKDLKTVFSKAKRMARAIYGDKCKVLNSPGQQSITFPSGETLEFAILAKPQDYENYHGQEFSWIGWEELTQWPTFDAYLGMFSTLRSGVVGIPLRVRATTNPSGAGHNWVKRRFKLSGYAGKAIGEIVDACDINSNPLHKAVAILGELSENFVLLTAQPDYLDQIKASATSKALYDSWVYGSWDITSGGMFDDIWHDAKHHMVVPRFDIPKSWRIDRSFDWGSAKPFSVTWWAQSDGSDVRLPNGKTLHTLKGDLFTIHEWLGCSPQDPDKGLNLSPLDVAKGIIQREINYGIHDRVKAGPADNAIHTEDGRESVASLMNPKNGITIDGKRYRGVTWLPSNKSPGSRKQGAQVLRQRMQNTIPIEGKPRESTGLFIFEDCKNFAEFIVPLPRDPKDPEDVDSSANDHKYDENRYRLLEIPTPPAKVGRIRGIGY